MSDLYDFYTDIVFIFDFRFASGRTVNKAAFWTALIVLQRVSNGICNIRFFRFLKGWLFVPRLSAFWLAGVTAGIRDGLVFVYRRLWSGRAGIAAIVVKECFRMGQLVLELFNNSIFFCKSFLILLLVFFFWFFELFNRLAQSSDFFLVSKDTVFLFFYFCGCFFEIAAQVAGKFYHRSQGAFLNMFEMEAHVFW